MIKNLSLIVFSVCSIFAFGQEVKSNIQSPTEFLGYDLGSYFSRHHQVVDYFKHLANEPSLELETYGETSERRELMLAYVSSPENIKNLEQIKTAHKEGKEESVSIVWLSYNVHGNEASSTEASMLTAYELITDHQDWLKDVVVIIDPCLNPDGRDRYVNWYNQKKNKVHNTDANSEEHNEAWPSGRFNHYLFDLNRDWVWLTQAESAQRVTVYNKWQPHVHVDFHEQFFNNPYYFAPAAAPMHESITDWQKEFQFNLGKNHTKYFDENGWLYFTREVFDLLYPSYGDTYPTFNGAIGMTYEQGGHGRAGLGVINSEGDELHLKDRIAHHHTTGISTVEFSVLNTQKLIEEYQDFTTQNDFKYKSYVLSGDDEKMRQLMHLLKLHEIEFQVGDGASVKGYNYASGETEKISMTEQHLIVHSNQRKGTLVNVLFEPETALEDSLTYDITSWSLPFVYGLDCIASEKEVSGKAYSAPTEDPNMDFKKSYAYLIRWNSMIDASALSQLLQAGIRVRYAEEAFTFGENEYAPGTLIILHTENESEHFMHDLAVICNSRGLDIDFASTGMVDTGKDFGSESVKLISKKRVGILSGEGVSPTDAGEVWHFFEQDLNYPVTVLTADALNTESLSNLDVLVLPTGWYKLPNEDLKEWVMKGGRIISIGGAVSMLESDSTTELTAKEEVEPTEKEEYADAHIHHSERDRETITEEVKGAVYRCKVDASHPLAFGYGDEYFTLKLDATAYELLPNGDNVVFIDEGVTPTAGFAGAKAQEYQGNSLVFGVESVENGSIVYLVDNPLFRGFWENGKLFFVNAVFFN